MAGRQHGIPDGNGEAKDIFEMGPKIARERRRERDRDRETEIERQKSIERRRKGK